MSKASEKTRFDFIFVINRSQVTCKYRLTTLRVCLRYHIFVAFPKYAYRLFGPLISSRLRLGF